VLKLLSLSDAERLRRFMLEAGYEEENLRVKMGVKDLPSTRLRNLPRLLDATREPSRINTLLRWFWIGIPQDASASGEHLPSWFIPLALQCGLLHQHGAGLAPEAMFLPTDRFIFAADHTSKIDSADRDLVLWPNPTSRLLSRFTVRRPSRATLDVGTGTGIQALMAAAHSEKVVATDLNQRAVAFAAFNARLNGIENIECVAGEGYAPVAGRKFDLIVSNPPFFVSPSTQYLFCDNSMDLDQLCRHLACEAPNYLNEGGYFQMLCEWAEVEGQTWQERLAEWFEASGCDVWVRKGYSQDPADYAEERIRSTVSSSDHDAELFASYMEYYRARKVKAICGGIVIMHRRSGENWIFMEEVTSTPKQPFGDLVASGFEARDFLQSHTADEQLLGVKPTLSPNAQLEQTFRQDDSGWQPQGLTVRLVKGFEFFFGLQPLVAGFLSGCDGTRTFAELIDAFASKANAPHEQIQKECLAVARKLIERGFLLVTQQQP
jgi:SAM-dependent methyltransferase